MTTPTNEAFMKRLLDDDQHRPIFAAVLAVGGTGLAGYASWYALTSVSEAAMPLTIGLVLLTVGILLFWGNASEDRRRLAELSVGWREIVWIYPMSVTRSSGTSHSVCFGNEHGSCDAIGLPAPMSAAMQDELVRRFPSATFGFNPTMEQRFKADPKSFRLAAPPATRMRIRHPRELSLINAAEKSIEASIVVVGSGAKGFARSVARTGSASLPAHDGELEHTVITLGPIRGWTPRLFVYALDASLSTIAMGTELTAIATAVVLVQTSEAGSRLEPALFPLAKTTRTGKGALAFVGPQSALAELVRDAAIEPDFSVHGSDEAMLVLKQLTRRIFESLPASA